VGAQRRELGGRGRVLAGDRHAHLVEVDVGAGGHRDDDLDLAAVTLDVRDRGAVGGLRGPAEAEDEPSDERDERATESPRVSRHQIPSMAKSIGSTVTLAWAIFSRLFGRSPVALRLPRLRPSKSNPALWSKA